MNAFMGFIQVATAAAQGAKALATLKMPPPGTKTITGNVVIILAWIAAYFSLDIPLDVLNAAAGILLAGANMVLRKLTKGPLGNSPGEG